MYYTQKTDSIQGALALNPCVRHTKTLYFGDRVWSYSRREGGEGTMGRFGGGWNIELGFQSGSFKNLITLRGVIVNFWFFSARFDVQQEYNNEEKARKTDSEIAAKNRHWS